VRYRHNGRPAIRISSFPPTSVSFVDGQHRACGDRQPGQRRTGRCRECGKPFTGDRPMVRCPAPGCCAWVSVQLGVLKRHDVAHNVACSDRDQRKRKIRCPGGGQRIRVDLTYDQHRALLYKERLEATGSIINRRPTHVRFVGTPPVPPPVCRMGPTAA
jgi:hypothetical protein